MDMACDDDCGDDYDPLCDCLTCSVTRAVAMRLTGDEGSRMMLTKMFGVVAKALKDPRATSPSGALKVAKGVAVVAEMLMDIAGHLEPEATRPAVEPSRN